jgi:pimeloyl-ACP methyl ester carboxylesterase
MSEVQAQIGFAHVGDARLYYEDAGEGTPVVMVHAGVADSRQWNQEFAVFAGRYRVIRYDLRGYGRSEPVEGEFSHLADLTALLDHLGLDEPIVIMGCSMGGGLAMDFALTHPTRVMGLIMVGSAPSGLELDIPVPAIFTEVEKAYTAGQLDLAAELETHAWFDGLGRTPDQVNQAMRKLAYDMNRLALAHDARHLGKRLPDTPSPAATRLNELSIPVLIVAGEHDMPYILAAADYMAENIPSAQKVPMADAAHLPNMDHPAEFQRIVQEYLAGL